MKGVLIRGYAASEGNRESIAIQICNQKIDYTSRACVEQHFMWRHYRLNLIGHIFVFSVFIMNNAGSDTLLILKLIVMWSGFSWHHYKCILFISLYFLMKVYHIMVFIDYAYLVFYTCTSCHFCFEVLLLGRHIFRCDFSVHWHLRLYSYLCIF